MAILMIAALVLAILAPLIARLLYFACSRQREYLADASAAQFTRLPSGLASALQKISTQQESKKIPVNRVVSPMYIINPLAAAGSSSALFIPSLNPRTAPPRSCPMLRSFFVPKIITTMSSTMSQCQMLNEPMTVLL